MEYSNLYTMILDMISSVSKNNKILSFDKPKELKIGFMLKDTSKSWEISLRSLKKWANESKTMKVYSQYNKNLIPEIEAVNDLLGINIMKEIASIEGRNLIADTINNRKL